MGRRAALLSGWLQIALAGWVLLDVLRRTLLGREPISLLVLNGGRGILREVQQVGP